MATTTIADLITKLQAQPDHTQEVNLWAGCGEAILYVGRTKEDEVIIMTDND